MIVMYEIEVTADDFAELLMEHRNYVTASEKNLTDHKVFNGEYICIYTVSKSGKRLGQMARRVKNITWADGVDEVLVEVE